MAMIQVLPRTNSTDVYREWWGSGPGAGADIEAHANEPYRVIRVVRNWLENVGVTTAPGPAQIAGAFSDFMRRTTTR